MAVDRKLFVIAFLLTVILLGSVGALSAMLSEKREARIDEMIKETYNNLNEMQIFTLMSEIYGDEVACLAFKSKLQELDESLWQLGVKIDQYRIASEEFTKDPFYLEQKKIFNENEVFYLLLLTKVKEACDLDQESIIFFYKNSKECSKCDDQSFVLADVKRETNDQVSVFSFDTDLGLTSIELLTAHYDIDEYPCMIINEKKTCGILDKETLLEEVCKESRIERCEERRAQEESVEGDTDGVV